MLRGPEPLTDRVVVGRVGKPHGLDGSFVVDDASEDPRWFERGARLQVGAVEAEVVAVKRAGGRPVIRLDIKPQRGTQLEVERSALPPTAEDEYYIFELVGLAVVEETGRELGTVRHGHAGCRQRRARARRRPGAADGRGVCPRRRSRGRTYCCRPRLLGLSGVTFAT